jgi:hypothetical protein
MVLVFAGLVLAAVQVAPVQIASVQARLTTVDGVARQVSLKNMNETGLVIESSGTAETIAWDNLLSVERTEAVSATPPVMRVELAGGSRVAVTEVTSEGNEATLVTRDQESLKAPLKELKSIRFKASSPATDPQWLGMLDSPRTSDVLVVRRAGDSLDEVQGIVKSITATVVTIDLDGDEVSAPIEKLEGVLFANATSSAEVGGLLVEDTQGSRWRATAIASPRDGFVSLDLGRSLKHEIRLDQVNRLESTGSVQFLALEAPAEKAYLPVTKLGLDASIAGQWFGANVDGNDLVMQAESHAEYRLGGEYSTLRGSAQFDPVVKVGGKCEMRILLDGKVVWDQVFDIEDPSARGYELPLGSARRLRFEVKTAGDGDLGDTLRIRQPRLVK